LWFKVGRKVIWAGGLRRPKEKGGGGPVDYIKEVRAQTGKEVFLFPIFLKP
jgi:hypothetical protein